MPEFIGPLNDPRFPDRPQHPDFWRIADALTALDGRAEGGKERTDVTLVPLVDPRH